MRFFIALEIPKENIPQFEEIQQNLRNLIPECRLTAIDKIHLTLAFVGEQPDEFKDKLINVITEAVREVPIFEVTPAYIDGFPTIHHPQVLWVGVKGDIDKILLIHERIRDGLKALSLPIDERRFVPHISIAKLNNNFSVDRNLETKLEKLMTISFDPIKIASIKLIESIPQDSFHHHNTLAEIKLLNPFEHKIEHPTRNAFSGAEEASSN